MVTVGVRELKARLSEYIARVSNGETVVVTQRNRPIAQLVPIERESPVVEGLRTLASEGTVRWAGGKPTGLPLSEAPVIVGPPTRHP
jgi:prevent-host-death family protein